MTSASDYGVKPDRTRVSLNIDPDPAFAGVISSHLRAMYDGLLTEPVPQRFVELLHRFDGTKNPPPSRGDGRNGTED